jgi:hypothetical protein
MKEAHISVISGRQSERIAYDFEAAGPGSNRYSTLARSAEKDSRAQRDRWNGSYWKRKFGGRRLCSEAVSTAVFLDLQLTYSARRASDG